MPQKRERSLDHHFKFDAYFHPVLFDPRFFLIRVNGQQVGGGGTLTDSSASLSPPISGTVRLWALQFVCDYLNRARRREKRAEKKMSQSPLLSRLLGGLVGWFSLSSSLVAWVNIGSTDDQSETQARNSATAAEDRTRCKIFQCTRTYATFNVFSLIV